MRAASAPQLHLLLSRPQLLAQKRCFVPSKCIWRCKRILVTAHVQDLRPVQAAGSSRRVMLLHTAAWTALPLLLALPAGATENAAVVQGLNKYIKRKRLDSLGSYVPLLLEARDQLIRTGRVMLQDPSAARSLLRSGSFSGLRDNVRAVGQYAAESSSKQRGEALVSAFFTSLQDLDFVLMTAIRDDSKLPEDARSKLDACIAALDSLLETVPDSEMAAAQRIIQALQESADLVPDEAV